MKAKMWCWLLPVLLTGCWQKSVHPFFNPSDVVSEPSLAGTWKEVRDEEKDGQPNSWTFTRAGDKGFTLVMVDKSDRLEYDADVFRLGERRFLNICSRTRNVSTVPANHLFQVVAVEPQLKVKMLNPDWISHWLKKHPGTLAHYVINDPEHPQDREKDEIVVTADTKALQNFIRDHISEEDFMTGEIVLACTSKSNAAK